VQPTAAPPAAPQTPSTTDVACPSCAQALALLAQEGEVKSRAQTERHIECLWQAASATKLAGGRSLTAGLDRGADDRRRLLVDLVGRCQDAVSAGLGGTRGRPAAERVEAPAEVPSVPVGEKTRPRRPVAPSGGAERRPTTNGKPAPATEGPPDGPASASLETCTSCRGALATLAANPRMSEQEQLDCLWSGASRTFDSRGRSLTHGLKKPKAGTAAARRMVQALKRVCGAVTGATGGRVVAKGAREERPPVQPDEDASGTGPRRLVTPEGNGAEAPTAGDATSARRVYAICGDVDDAEILAKALQRYMPEYELPDDWYQNGATVSVGDKKTWASLLNVLAGMGVTLIDLAPYGGTVPLVFNPPCWTIRGPAGSGGRRSAEPAGSKPTDVTPEGSPGSRTETKITNPVVDELRRFAQEIEDRRKYWRRDCYKIVAIELGLGPRKMRGGLRALVEQFENAAAGLATLAGLAQGLRPGPKIPQAAVEQALRSVLQKLAAIGEADPSNLVEILENSPTRAALKTAVAYLAALKDPHRYAVRLGTGLVLGLMDLICLLLRALHGDAESQGYIMALAAEMAVGGALSASKLTVFRTRKSVRSAPGRQTPETPDGPDSTRTRRPDGQSPKPDPDAPGTPGKIRRRKRSPPQKPGTTVIGHYPEYVQLADDLAANRFSIPKAQWDRMTEAQRWAANQRFLDDAIARGDTIRLATSPDKVRPGSYLEKETRYLTEHGYQLSRDGRSLLPSGGK